MLIRLARTQDLAQMLEIYRPYVEHTAISFEYEVPTAEEFTARFESITARCAWLVCELDGLVVGYAYAGPAFARAAYRWAADFSVYLAPEARRQGIGAALYGVLARMTAAQGYCVAYGVVSSGNVPSCRFHEALGYRMVAELPQIGFKLGQWHGIFWYEKRLCEPTTPESAPVAAPQMDWRGIEGLSL